MDDPGLDPALLTGALRALERINLVSATARAMWAPIARVARKGATLRVLDVGCGAGDVAMALERRARRAGLAVEVEACDLNGHAVAHARARAAELRAGVRFFECDVLRDFPRGYDVYACSLFLHHLRDADAVEVLRRMGAGRALVASDLVRSRAGYWAAHVGARCLTRSPVSRADGPASVAAAFTRAELRGLAAAAGLERALVRPQWPFRMLLEWQR
jgi:SAM-dependent methyltransferase